MVSLFSAGTILGLSIAWVPSSPVFQHGLELGGTARTLLYEPICEFSPRPAAWLRGATATSFLAALAAFAGFGPASRQAL